MTSAVSSENNKGDPYAENPYLSHAISQWDSAPGRRARGPRGTPCHRGTSCPRGTSCSLFGRRKNKILDLRLRIKGLSRTTALLSIFYRLNDNWSIYIDSSSLLPLRVEKEWQEGKKEGYYVYDIDQGGKTVILHNKVSGNRKSMNAKNSIFDLFSLIYYYRLNHAEFDDIYTFDFLESRSVSTVYFQNEGVKEIRIKQISMTHTFSVRRLKQIGGVGIEIYISNDHLNLPLKIIVPSKLPKNKVLNVEFIIDKYEPGPGLTDIPRIYRLL
jgi:hypothetical protein